MLTDKNIVCPKCEAQLCINRCGCAVTYTCPKCGWSIATTEWEPIDLDKTEYRIRLAEGTLINKETLSLVSEMTGKNFIDSKKIIERNEAIFIGKARTILEKKAFLTERGMGFVIEPDFPY